MRSDFQRITLFTAGAVEGKVSDELDNEIENVSELANKLRAVSLKLNCRGPFSSAYM